MTTQEAFDEIKKYYDLGIQYCKVTLGNGEKVTVRMHKDHKMNWKNNIICGNENVLSLVAGESETYQKHGDKYEWQINNIYQWEGEAEYEVEDFLNAVAEIERVIED